MEGLTLGIALTMHLGMEGDYNEIHPSIQYQKDGYSVGAYYNSNHRMSYYASKRFENPNGLWAEVGVVTGYNDSIAPLGRVGYRNLFVAPAYEEDFSLADDGSLISKGSSRIGIAIGTEFKF